MDAADGGVKRSLRRLSRSLALLLAACPGSHPAGDSGQSTDGGVSAQDLPYASEVVAFEPGESAGYGQDDLPDVVLGPPEGKGEQIGSLDVLSLGVGGEIVLGFGERVIEDGPGADFVVFENAFWAGGDPESVFAEPGEIAVSDDGAVWHTFTCDPDPSSGPAGRPVGCAGWSPTRAYDAADLVPLDPELSGGDAFDLAELDLHEARFVRIRDLSSEGEPDNAGFDLDAVGLVNYRSR
jgi:hypothetical protein